MPSSATALNALVFPAVVIALLCLAWQLWLLFRVRLTWRSWERSLDSATKLESRTFPWVQWVCSAFAANSPGRNCLTRADALQELELCLAATPARLRLRRWCIFVWPLGGLFSLIAIVWMVLDKGMSLPSAEALTGVVAWGLGLAVLLCAANLGLLQWVAGRAEPLRYRARCWFDTAVLPGLGREFQAATERTIGAMHKMAESFGRAASDFPAQMGRMSESADYLQSAAASWGGAMKSLSEQLKSTHANAARLQDAAQQSVAGMQAAGKGLASAIVEFRAVVDVHFQEAARQHQAAAQRLAEATGNFHDAATSLRGGCLTLQKSVNAHAKSFESSCLAIEQRLLPSQDRFGELLSRLTTESDLIGQGLEQLRRRIAMSAADLETVLPDTAATVAKFSGAANQFQMSVEQHFVIAAEQHASLASSLQAATVAQQNSATAMQAAVDQHRESLGDFAACLSSILEERRNWHQSHAVQEAALRDSLSAVHETSRTLLASLNRDLGPAQTSLRDAAGNVRRAADGLEGLVKGLDPVTNRLRELDDVFASVAKTVESIQRFADIRDSVDRLASSLDHIAVAVAHLPEQTRRLIHDAVARMSHDWRSSLRDGATSRGDNGTSR